MSDRRRTILVRFGTFYVYQIELGFGQVAFYIGHGDCPMVYGKVAEFTRAGSRYRCNGCDSVCSPKNAVRLRDALELIKIGLK